MLPSKVGIDNQFQIKSQILVDDWHLYIHKSYLEAVIPYRKPKEEVLNESEREINKIIN